MSRCTAQYCRYVDLVCSVDLSKRKNWLVRLDLFTSFQLAWSNLFVYVSHSCPSSNKTNIRLMLFATIATNWQNNTNSAILFSIMRCHWLWINKFVILEGSFTHIYTPRTRNNGNTSHFIGNIVCSSVVEPSIYTREQYSKSIVHDVV